MAKAFSRRPAHRELTVDAAGMRHALTMGSPQATCNCNWLTPDEHRDRSVLSIRGSVDGDIEIGESGYVFIRAVGGKGGNGGRGGDGQPGSTGTRGRDATRYSRGTNGGPGGNGGNAGNPTDGATGGDGGNVALTVADRDQGLLMLMKGNLVGGDIGFAGEGGRGGSGGAGGRGGSSYHWTETQSYTDGQGKRQTRTVFRSNPGGTNGRRGRDGASSAYRARDGQPGRDGQLRIVVVGKPRRANRIRIAIRSGAGHV